MVLLLAFAIPERARADGGGFSAGLKFGISGLQIAAGNSFANGESGKDAGLGIEMRPQLDLNMSALNTSFNFYYQTRVDSNFGSFPVSRVGFGVQYYPFGLPLHTTMLDNGVVLKQNKFAPYGGLNMIEFRPEGDFNVARLELSPEQRLQHSVPPTWNSSWSGRWQPRPRARP